MENTPETMIVRPFWIKKITKSQKNSEKTRKKVIQTNAGKRSNFWPKKSSKFVKFLIFFEKKLKITQYTAQNAFVRPHVTKKLIEL